VLREAPVLAELDLPALVAEVRRAGMEVEMHDGGVRLPELPGATARAAYRIVQEGLTNARKHAPGMPVTVRLDGGPDQGLAIEVRNPVVRAPRGEGAGLAGMRERAELAGGRVEQAGIEEGEFRLAVWLPWPV
jgi:signal transduction histidine kinase